jgi:hypothetical protein
MMESYEENHVRELFITLKLRRPHTNAKTRSKKNVSWSVSLLESAVSSLER